MLSTHFKYEDTAPYTEGKLASWPICVLTHVVYPGDASGGGPGLHPAVKINIPALVDGEGGDGLAQTHLHPGRVWKHKSFFSAQQQYSGIFSMGAVF